MRGFVKPVLKLIVHMFLIAGSYWAIKAIFADSTARSAYGLLGSWLFALYAGLRFRLHTNVPLLAILLVTLMSWVLSRFLLGELSIPIYAHDGGTSTTGLVRQAVAYTFFIASPLLLNQALDWIQQAVHSRLNTKGTRQESDHP